MLWKRHISAVDSSWSNCRRIYYCCAALKSDQVPLARLASAVEGSVGGSSVHWREAPAMLSCRTAPLEAGKTMRMWRGRQIWMRQHATLLDRWRVALGIAAGVSGEKAPIFHIWGQPMIRCDETSLCPPDNMASKGKKMSCHQAQFPDGVAQRMANPLQQFWITYKLL